MRMRLRAVVRKAVLRRQLERAHDVALIGRRRGDGAALIRSRRLGVAVERLKGGDYGKCAACGRPIGDARLKLLPGVGTCARCQKRIDGRR
jgi:RNA polymerase-binding transcription factor DksA